MRNHEQGCPPGPRPQARSTDVCSKMKFEYIYCWTQTWHLKLDSDRGRLDSNFVMGMKRETETWGQCLDP